jgi:hypothetical protein
LAARSYNALFVTHDTGHYGAARSLQTFLASYETQRADLLINRRLLRQNDIEAIRSCFGPHVANIWEGLLPFDRCFHGKPTMTVPLLARNALASWGRGRLLDRIAAESFDFIYLNSLALHGLIDPRLPFIIHVREIYDGTNPEAVKFLDKARGVIFIDGATKAAFPQLSAPWIILNNPFDMRVGDPNKVKSMCDRLNIRGRTVFTLIGMMNENKGTDFVINSFCRVARHDAILLLVGNGSEAYETYCRKLANGSPDVIFHGFEEDVASIYNMSDYIIRAEAYPCVGRTIYEGLYSGCEVVVPGDTSTAGDIFEYDRFKEKIYFYPPRQSEALESIFRNLKKLDVRGPSSMSNVCDFINGFDSFVGKVVSCSRMLTSAGSMTGATGLS